MSRTELYGIRKSGNLFHMANIWNAWRSGPMIWEAMEKKYLPSLPRPLWVTRKEEEQDYYTRTSQMHKPEGMNEIWALINSDRVSRGDKIVLGSTLDRMVVMKENFDEMVNAFFHFGAETSLKEQAAVIANYPGIIGVAWNQTSVCSMSDMLKGVNNKPYNIFRQKDHTNIFEVLGPKPKESLRDMLANGGVTM